MAAACALLLGAASLQASAPAAPRAQVSGLSVLTLLGAPGDHAGYAVADAGDTNGDGLHDAGRCQRRPAR